MLCWVKHKLHQGFWNGIQKGQVTSMTLKFGVLNLQCSVQWTMLSSFGPFFEIALLCLGFVFSPACACMLSHFNYTWLFATLWTVALQAPLSMRLSRQEYWGGLPFPPPGDLLTQRSNPGLPHCRWIIYLLSHQGSPQIVGEVVCVCVCVCVCARLRNVLPERSLKNKTYNALC